MRSLRWCLPLLWWVAGGAIAQDNIDVAPAASASAAPQPDRTVRDAEFGVIARHFGLERHVEMYQWRRSPQGYALAWSTQPLDSSGFAPDHDNPSFPLRGRRWLAKAITVDGRPLDARVIATLGQWRGFRPAFSALPGNLAVTFQPEGDGLGTAENPLAPQVGDLRIHWRELVLPPLVDRIQLRNGRWQLTQTQTATPAVIDPSSPVPGLSDLPPRRRQGWFAGAVAMLLVAAAIVVSRRRRRKPQSPEA